MADTRWTPEQERAISLRGCDILVSAAAGAGKTAVLVERVIRQVTAEAAPLDLERLLAVTFTEKAAAEMKQRIRASLEAAAARSPGEPRLARQLALLDRAQISTIHAFCLHVLRRFFYKAGLDPSFRVLDDNEAELLRQDALAELFEALYQDEGEYGAAFQGLVDRYGGAGVDEGLQAVVLRLHDFARTQASMERWLDESAAPPATTAIWETPWMRYMIGRAARDLSRALAYAQDALAVILGPGGPSTYEAAVEEDIAFFRDTIRALNAAPPGVALQAMKDFAFSRLKPDRKSDPDKREAARDLRDRAKDVFAKVRDSALTRPAQDLEREIGEARPFMATLVRVVRDLDRRYSEKKMDRGGVDFSDLERHCLAVLESDGCQVAKDLRKDYDCVLVDEYQDTNPLQERILSLVSAGEAGPGNRFMVGDLKQSIYRFRLAEPRIFLDKFTRFGTADPSGEQPGVRIDLSTNFRSREEVLDAVNHVFSGVMTPDVAEIDYSGGHELRAGAPYPKDPGGRFRAELHLVERVDLGQGDDGGAATPEVSAAAGDEPADPATGEGPGEGGSVDKVEELEALEKEALVVANMINRMVDPRQPLTLWDAKAKSARPCSFRDIAVLMRSTKDRANAVLEVLGKCDVPAYADTGAGYFQAREVEVALSLLAVIDNPRQDIPLAAVLRSPIVGLDASQLAEIRAAFKKGEFYDAVRAFAKEEGDLAAALTRFLAGLERWRTMARRLPLAEVLWTILRETRYQDYVGGLPGGAQRQANLRALCDRAREFDSFGRHGLFRFLRFIEKIRDAEGDLGTARALGEHEDVVRVMSVHKAKGLEFPVVFVIDLGKRFNMEDVRQDVLFHRDLGIGPAYVDLDHRVKYPTGLHQAISMRIREENLAEEMRVLYVALTRAKEKLVMVGSARDLAGKLRGWQRLDAAAAQTGLDWVCPVALGASESSPVQVSFWGTPDGQKVPSPGQKTVAEQGLTWRDVRDLRVPATSDPSVYDEVERRMTWSYPYAASSVSFAKMSVGELKRRLEGEDAAWTEPSPEAAGEEAKAATISALAAADFPSRRADPVQRGIAVHSLLARMRWESATPEGIRDEARRLAEHGLVEPPGVDGEDLGRVAAFLGSPEGQSLAGAGRDGLIRREVPFTMKVPAEAFEDRVVAVAGGRTASRAASGHDIVVVQGVIDVLLDRDGGLAVFDYKTDSVRESALPARFATYVPQVSLYALAAERILRKPVKRAALVFLGPGKTLDVDWRAYLRSRGMLGY